MNQPRKFQRLKKLVFLFVLMSFLSAIAMPVLAIGTTGVLSGKVLDRDTGKPVDNVFITAKSPSDTYTAVTDATGFFSIAGVAVGVYDVTAERVGYQSITLAGVLVTADATTNIQFDVTSKAVEVTGVTVTAARAPVVNPRQTMVNYGYSSQEFREVQPGPASVSLYSTGFITGYETLPGVQVGFDAYYGQTSPHIRGGSGSDIGYAYDGIPTYETNTNTFGTNLSYVGTQRLDFYTGGYPAQYGNFLSGYINQVAPRGSGPIHGSLEYQYGFWVDQGSRLPSYDTATGTIPTYNGPRAYSPTVINLELMGKDRKFSYYFNHLLQDSGAVVYANGVDIKPYIFEYGAGVQHSAQVRDTVLNLVYDLDNYNSLQFLGYTGTGKFNFAGFQELPCNPAIFGAGCLASNTGTGFNETFNAFNIRPLSDAHQTSTQDLEKFEWTHRFPGAGKVLSLRLWRFNPAVYFNYFDAGSFTFWEFRRSAVSGILLQHENQLTPEHLLNVGASFSYSKNYFLSTRFDLGAPADQSGFHFNSAQGILWGPPGTGAAAFGTLNRLATADTQTWGAWLSDEWRPTPKWVVQLGVRFDRQNYMKLTGPGIVTDANGLPFVSPSICPNGGLCLDPARFNPQQLSPRLGASYKLSNKLTMKASYGKFITFAPARNVDAVRLSSTNPASSAFLPGFANRTPAAFQIPGSKSQHGENIDVSWEYQLDDNTYVKMTPYIKHILDPLQSITVGGVPVFTNAGTLQSKGIELFIKSRGWNNLSGWLSYTYSTTRGSQLPNQTDAEVASGVFTAAQAIADATQVVPVAYDQRHVLSINLNYKVPGNKFEVAPTFVYGSGYPFGIGLNQLRAQAGIEGCVFGTPNCSNALNERGFNSLRSPGWWLGNVAVTYHFNDNLKGILSVFNVLNTSQIFARDNSVTGGGYAETVFNGYTADDGATPILPQYDPLRGSYAPIGYAGLRQFYFTLQYKL